MERLAKSGPIIRHVAGMVDPVKLSNEYGLIAPPRKRSVQARSGGKLDMAPEVVWISPNLRAPLSLFAEAS